MDTVHDIGGREGFGAVRWQKDKDDIAFHEEWQARAWAMCMRTFAGWRGKPEIWTLDWFRHVRERIEPIDYLTRNYYDQWVQSLAATLIDNGAIRLDELVPDFAARKEGSPSDTNVAQTQKSSTLTGGESNEMREAAPLFTVGQKVQTKMSVAASHTRLPAYVRGRVGVIEEYHGTQPLADASACGVVKPEHLYTVGFDASELWPEAQGRRERVFVDAWESYLGPA